MNNTIKRFFALAIAVQTLSGITAASIPEIVEQMKNAKRENVVLPNGTTITDLARYCRDWAIESKIDYSGIALRTDTPSIKVSLENVKGLSLYDVLEMGCASSYHFLPLRRMALSIFIQTYLNTSKLANGQIHKVRNLKRNGLVALMVTLTLLSS